jgi:alcohol dehydrogenase (cytochrome c)
MQRWIAMSVMCAAAVGTAALLAQGPSTGRAVTYDDLLAGFKDTASWLSYSGDYTGRRHSPLTQITPDNVARLSPRWTFQTEIAAPGRGFETTPLVIDGVVYATAVSNRAWAIDARTGRSLWRYARTLPPGVKVCCGQVNRGFAALGDRLFMGTLDAHLVALERKSGAVAWDVTVADNQQGYSITMAPLVVKDKVIVGVAGGDYGGVRGSVDAYDARTGARLWRFYTIPAPGERGSETWPGAAALALGGGGLYGHGSYDPTLNLVYFGTGNPVPQYYGADRLGDNLYTSSLVALDADTGALRWHYQFTPHDLHDWDSSHVPVLADLPIANQLRRVVMVANRNGFFYVLDRETGQLILGKPFLKNTNWAREIGADGRPIVLDDVGSKDKCLPDQRGGTNFMPPSYDPVRRLFFVTARETCAVWAPAKPASLALGTYIPGGAPQRLKGLPDQYVALRALDPTTGVVRWEHQFEKYPSDVMLNLAGGATSTASGMVFSGDNEGYLNAFESGTGRLLWRFQLGAPVWGIAPVTYVLDGQQWVLIPSGVTLTAFALSGAPAVGSSR